MIQYFCRNCGEPIRDASEIDSSTPWIHRSTGNMFCAVDGVVPIFVTEEQAADRTVAAPPSHGYIAMWRGQRLEIYANSTLAAQTVAAIEFGARRQHEVNVALAEVDGEPYVHTAVD